MKILFSELFLNIVYIIQLHRKYTLNSTLIGPVVTFHKYSYNRNGSVNIGRLVLLYIPKHHDPFIPHLVLGVMHVAKKITQMFFSRKQIYWKYCGLGLGTLNI